MPIDNPAHVGIGRRTLRLFTPLAMLVLIAPALLTACSDIDDAEASVPDVTAEDTGGLQPGEPMPELTGEIAWLDSVPAEFMTSGNVVLIDFWSYSCADCLRSLDAVEDWYQRYQAHGLSVVGVHTPAFRFDEDADQLQQAVVERGVHYPVVQDNDHAMWTAFENEAWPSRYVLGPDGTIVHRFVGGGGYADTESAIRAALESAGQDLSAVLPRYSVAPAPDSESIATSRDLYFGYRHNYHPAGVYAAQPDYYSAPEEPLVFDDPGPPYEDGLWYAQGTWSVDEDALVHMHESEGAPGYVAFQFHAQSVALVMGPTTTSPVDVMVQLDGLPIPTNLAGPDVWWDDGGRSIVTLDGPRIYYVVELPESASYSMQVSPHDGGLSLYLASFGSRIE